MEISLNILVVGLPRQILSYFISISFFVTIGVTLIEALAARILVVEARSGGQITMFVEELDLLVSTRLPVELPKAILKIIESYKSNSLDTIRSYFIRKIGDVAVISFLVKLYSNMINCPVAI